MYKKQFNTQNISKYVGYKLLAHLAKPRAQLSIKFFTNDPDGWLIDKVIYKNKSGDITNDEGIIEKDFNDWIKYLLDKGYEKN